MGLYVWIAIGCVVGIVGRAMALRQVKADWLEAMLMGIAGAVVGGWFGTRAVRGNGIDNLGWLAMVTAATGAAVLVSTYILQRRNKKPRMGKIQSVSESRKKAA